LPHGMREQFMRRLDAVEADLAVARASAPESAPRADEADYRAATQAADQALKTAPPDAPDALPPALDDLAGQAEAEARVLAEQLGVEFRDADLDGVAEAAEKAERWARAAELATMCLVRGG